MCGERLAELIGFGADPLNQLVNLVGVALRGFKFVAEPLHALQSIADLV